MHIDAIVDGVRETLTARGFTQIAPIPGYSNGYHKQVFEDGIDVHFAYRWDHPTNPVELDMYFHVPDIFDQLHVVKKRFPVQNLRRGYVAEVLFPSSRQYEILLRTCAQLALSRWWENFARKMEKRACNVQLRWCAGAPDQTIVSAVEQTVLYTVDVVANNLRMIRRTATLADK